MGSNIISAKDHALRMRLYTKGASDAAIGRSVGRSARAIQHWRSLNALAPNMPAPPKGTKRFDLEERRRLYNLAFSDREIARQTGASPRSIFFWRRARGLMPNGQRTAITIEERAARMFLYNLGYSDEHIARERHVTGPSIWSWRKRWGLPTIHKPLGHKAERRARRQDAALTRIRSAVGRRLSPDIAADAVADLYLACLSGEVSLDAIEQEARKFGNRVLEQYASKFGPRSLDEEIHDDSGSTLLDTLADERSSDWLEEMGATVW